MSTWTSGYVADIDYTYGYYTELNPMRSRYAMLRSGIVMPEIRTACELGFGQGLSTNIHAAASNVEWYGTDFNPAQAGFAQELASHSNSGAKLYDEAFLDFCNRKDLPDFDFICLHGIWSWVSDENKEIIVDFIRRKLRVGGLVYVSYNTLPGWAPFAPMRHLMTQHAEMVGSSASGIINRVDGAIEFADKLLATEPLFLHANPQIKERMERLKQQSRHYLAHEYFNLDWEPMHFSKMAEWLETAKLDFACSAHYLDHLDAINLRPDQSSFIESIHDVVLHQSVRDFMVNTQFRKDYWVRGRRKIRAYEQSQLIKDFRVVLGVNRAGIELKVTGARGEADVNMDIYNPVLDLLADNKVKTIEQITASLSDNPQIGSQQILECMLVLIGSGYVYPAQTDKEISAAKKKTNALNAHLLEKAKGGSEITWLASPVTAGGISVNPFTQHFINALKEVQGTPENLANKVWAHLSILGQKLIVEGKQLESDEENLAELTREAKKFIGYELPVLKGLQII